MSLKGARMSSLKDKIDGTEVPEVPVEAEKPVEEKSKVKKVNKKEKI